MSIIIIILPKHHATILILLKKKNVMALSIGIKNSKIASMRLLISIKSCQNTQFQRILF